MVVTQQPLKRKSEKLEIIKGLEWTATRNKKENK